MIAGRRLKVSRNMALLPAHLSLARTVMDAPHLSTTGGCRKRPLRLRIILPKDLNQAPHKRCRRRFYLERMKRAPALSKPSDILQSSSPSPPTSSPESGSTTTRSEQSCSVCRGAYCSRCRASCRMRSARLSLKALPISRTSTSQRDLWLQALLRVVPDMACLELHTLMDGQCSLGIMRLKSREELGKMTDGRPSVFCQAMIEESPAAFVVVKVDFSATSELREFQAATLMHHQPVGQRSPHLLYPHPAWGALTSTQQQRVQVYPMLTGGALIDVMNDGRGLGLNAGCAQRIVWARQLVSAVEAMWDLGLAHNDIKLDNIVFDRLGPGRKVVLLDFNLSGFSMARARLRIGSKQTMMPEMWFGTKVGQEPSSFLRSVEGDRFSLGCCVFSIIFNTTFIDRSCSYGARMWEGCSMEMRSRDTATAFLRQCRLLHLTDFCASIWSLPAGAPFSTGMVRPHFTRMPPAKQRDARERFARFAVAFAEAFVVKGNPPRQSQSDMHAWLKQRQGSLWTHASVVDVAAEEDSTATAVLTATGAGEVGNAAAGAGEVGNAAAGAGAGAGAGASTGAGDEQ